MRSKSKTINFEKTKNEEVETPGEIKIANLPLPADNKYDAKVGNQFVPADNNSDASSYMGSEKFEMFDFGRNRLDSNPMDKSSNG